MINTTETGTSPTSWTYNDGCSYRLPCGRCRLTMDTCPENNCGNGITWTKTTWPDRADWNMTLFTDKEYPFTTVTTTAAMTDDGKDTEKKKLRC